MILPKILFCRLGTTFQRKKLFISKLVLLMIKVLSQNTGYVNYVGNSEYKMRCLNYMFMLNVSTWMLCINKSTCFLPVVYT